VSGQRRNFIVLAIADRDGQGFPETAHLRLLQLIEASAPDTRVSSPRGFIAFYLPLSRAVAAVEDVISALEALRDGDQAYTSLGIGLAHGPLIADFDWRGRVKPAFLPVGETANRASRASVTEQTYRDILAELHETRKT
jgi:class 3 adenylate cyclase